MILVDTSVWVDHLRCSDEQLAALLERGGAAMHPFVVGEIASGSLARRAAVLELLEARFGEIPADIADIVDATTEQIGRAHV